VEHLGAADKDALLVSLADKVHNARSILRDLRKPEVGEAVWGRFKASKSDTLWHYRELAAAFRTRLPGQLADELGEIVDALAKT
jgi:(p)ppGpp synthase/HD superfamily hydrolase